MRVTAPHRTQVIDDVVATGAVSAYRLLETDRSTYQGSTDLARWVDADELPTLPLVDLARTAPGAGCVPLSRERANAMCAGNRGQR